MGAPPPPARVPVARGHPWDRSVTPGCGSASPKTTSWGSGGLAARPPPSRDRTQFAKNIHFFPKQCPQGQTTGLGQELQDLRVPQSPPQPSPCPPPPAAPTSPDTFPSPPLGTPSPLSPRPPKITDFPISSCTRCPCHPLQHQPSSAHATNVSPNPGGRPGCPPSSNYITQSPGLFSFVLPPAPRSSTLFA